jgi:single-strand DNA-binding protein
MTAQKTDETEALADQGAHVNEVRLVGRVAADPELREMPSGDTVWSLRVNVERPPGKARDRQRVDSLDCSVWGGRVKQQVRTWSPGDLVEVVGTLHRRFFRSGGAVMSRVDVELTRGKVIRRAGSG